MRFLAIVVVVLAACSRTPAAPGPAVGGAPSVFVNEGGLLSPLRNGERVAVVGGWAELSFSPYPPTQRTELDVRVIDGSSGRPAPAEVSVLYEMLGMEHGTVVQRAIRADDRYRLPLNLAMPGVWRFQIRVARAAAETTIVLVVPEVRQ